MATSKTGMAERLTEILLVEDEAAHVALIQRSFADREASVRLAVAGSIEQARAHLEASVPDLVIADLRLPDGEGVALVAQAAGRYPVVIMTSHGDEQVAVEAMRAGALDYVVKSGVTLGEIPHIAERALREWRYIIDRKQAEEALRKSEAEYRSLFEYASDAIFIFEVPGTRFLKINSKAVNLILYDVQELHGMTVFDLDLPENRSYMEAVIQRTLDEGSVLFEHQFRRKDGVIIPVEMSMRRIKYGGRQAVQSFVRDITERKRLIEEILEISGREQRRIGQDLHDELGQLLTGIGFILAELENDLRRKNLPETDTAASIGGMVEEAIAQTRALAQGLSPVGLESGGLPDALGELARTVRRVYGVICTLVCTGPIYIADQKVAIHVYRIAQEAVNNAVKHGKATHIVIELSQRNEVTTLTVQDDGVGIPEASRRGRGMGLRTMEYRASMVRGSFDVRRAPDRGTVVTCHFITDSVQRVAD